MNTIYCEKDGKKANCGYSKDKLRKCRVGGPLIYETYDLYQGNFGDGIPKIESDKYKLELKGRDLYVCGDPREYDFLKDVSNYKTVKLFTLMTNLKNTLNQQIPNEEYPDYFFRSFKLDDVLSHLNCDVMLKCEKDGKKIIVREIKVSLDGKYYKDVTVDSVICEYKASLYNFAPFVYDIIGVDILSKRKEDMIIYLISELLEEKGGIAPTLEQLILDNKVTADYIVSTIKTLIRFVKETHMQVKDPYPSDFVITDNRIYLTDYDNVEIITDISTISLRVIEQSNFFIRDLLYTPYTGTFGSKEHINSMGKLNELIRNYSMIRIMAGIEKAYNTNDLKSDDIVIYYSDEMKTEFTPSWIKMLAYPTMDNMIDSYYRNLLLVNILSKFKAEKLPHIKNTFKIILSDTDNLSTVLKKVYNKPTYDNIQNILNLKYNININNFL
jgi:hypothetical protein